MPPCRGKHYLVIGREDLSGWPEAKALINAISAAVAKFLFEDVITRHGCFGQLTVDGGPENKDMVEQLTSRYKIKRLVVSAYHPQANRMVERGHRPLVDSLNKITEQGYGDWVSNLHAVLWADRTTTRASTGETPYRLMYGSDAILPIELSVPTWQTLPWDSVISTADLLAVRARQVQRRNKDFKEAALYLQRTRAENQELFNEKHRLRAKDFNVGDFVLLYDTKLDNNHSSKLIYKWMGPYRIHKAI